MTPPQSPHHLPADRPPDPPGGQEPAPQPPPPPPAPAALTPEDAKVLVEEWKTVIGVQMHFNEIIVRMRTTGVSVVIAVYGAAAFSISQFPRKFLVAFGHPFHPSAAILVFGLLLLFSIFALDYIYYFRMLVAAVRQGERLDQQMRVRTLSGLHLFGLTTLISERVSRGRARISLILFYGLPFLAGLGALWYVLYEYPGGGAYF